MLDADGVAGRGVFVAAMVKDANEAVTDGERVGLACGDGEQAVDKTRIIAKKIMLFIITPKGDYPTSIITFLA